MRTRAKYVCIVSTSLIREATSQLGKDISRTIYRKEFRIVNNRRPIYIRMAQSLYEQLDQHQYLLAIFSIREKQEHEKLPFDLCWQIDLYPITQMEDMFVHFKDTFQPCRRWAKKIFRCIFPIQTPSEQAQINQIGLAEIKTKLHQLVEELDL